MDFKSLWSGLKKPSEDIQDICSFLGIKEEHAKRLKAFEKESPFWYNHRTVLYWIHRLFENNHDILTEEEEDVNQHSLKDQFLTLGFTDSRSQMLSDWFKCTPLSAHQTPYYFAKRYAESAFDAFAYYIEPVSYPLEGEIGELQSVNVESYDRGIEEEEDIPDHLKVQYINLSCLQSIDHDRLPKSDTQYRVLYHATNHQSADHIIRNGIFIHFGNLDQDFSDGSGFYLSENVSYAIAWATCKSFLSSPAIMCFKIPQAVFANRKGLVLDAEKSEDLKIWRDIVHDYESVGKEEKILQYSGGLDKLDYVEGPISIDQTKIYDKDVSQICILSHDLSDAINDPRYIHMVYFG